MGTEGETFTVKGLNGDKPYTIGKDSVVILARDHEGAVRGFLHFVPAYGRPAMSLSFMRRDPRTPNGLTEFLIVRSIELLGERGIEELSLNFAAFGRLLERPSGDPCAAARRSSSSPTRRGSAA